MYNHQLDTFICVADSQEEMDALLRLEIPNNAYFNEQGIYNYHGGGSILFDREDIQAWVLEQQKRSIEA